MVVTLRNWRFEDVDALVRYANNPNVAQNLKDRFPYPYTRADAESWVCRVVNSPHATMNFAIDVDGEAVGSVGFERLNDVYRLTAEIGYWVAEPFWGRGIATRALGETTEYAFANFDFERIQAMVFEANAASVRVLEKCGYTLEGRMRRHVYKNGNIWDSLVYARLRSR